MEFVISRPACVNSNDCRRIKLISVSHMLLLLSIDDHTTQGKQLLSMYRISSNTSRALNNSNVGLENPGKSFCFGRKTLQFCVLKSWKTSCSVCGNHVIP